MPLLTTGQAPTTSAVKGGAAPTATGLRITAAPLDVSASVLRQAKDYSVVVVILDDVGLEKFQQYAAITGNVSQVIRIPNIKTHVVNRGITFNKCWVYPVCGPTRGAMESELYPQHSGFMANITDNPLISSGNFYLGQDPAVPDDRTRQKIQTIAHALRNGRPKNAYKLGKFGKSHMQQNDYFTWPTGGAGWTTFKGHMVNLANHYSWPYIVTARDLLTGESDIVSSVTSTVYGPEQELGDMEAFVDAALAADDAPFLLWWCPSVGHASYQAPPTTGIGAVGALSQGDWTTAFGGVYPAPGTDLNFVATLDSTERAKKIMCQKHQIESADEVFGRLITKLQANGQYDNTVFMVIVDNGTSTDVVEAPYDDTHAKRSVYAQGINVPFFVSGPVCGQVPRASNEPINAVDIGTTIRDICKAYPQAHAADIASGGRPRDGVSFLRHLRDPAIPSPRTVNFSMIGGPSSGYGWNPTTRVYTSAPTQGSYTVTDGTHTLLRLGGTPPTEKLFLATSFKQPDSENLMITAPNDTATIAALSKLRPLLNALITT